MFLSCDYKLLVRREDVTFKLTYVLTSRQFIDKSLNQSSVSSLTAGVVPQQARHMAPEEQEEQEEPEEQEEQEEDEGRPCSSAERRPAGRSSAGND